MRKSAVAAGSVLAVGLMGVGGTAFASSGGPASYTPENGEDTQPSTSQATNHAHADADAEAVRAGLINVQAPIAADLHEGVANDLNVQDAVHDVVRVGDVVPAAAAKNVNLNGGSDNTNQDAPAPSGKSGGAASAESNADASAQGGAHGGASAHAEAGSVSLGNTLSGAVSSATATVNSVTNIGGDLSLTQ